MTIWRPGFAVVGDFVNCLFTIVYCVLAVCHFVSLCLQFSADFICFVYFGTSFRHFVVFNAIFFALPILDAYQSGECCGKPDNTHL